MIDKLISAIEIEQTQLAHQSMISPARDQFDHGLVVGRYQGLQQAKDLITRLLDEADEKEREFERRF